MIKKTINNLKSDYVFRTYAFTFISILITFGYAIYNGVLGITKLSIWNGSICVYYLLLLSIKALLMIERRNTNEQKRNRVILFSFILLFVTTIAMITPAILMINNQRSYDLGLIYAIAMAAYTTYSVTTAFIHFNKARSNENQVVKQIRLINIASALMSITVLQNTMILANGGIDESMQLLSAISSFAIITAITILTIVEFCNFKKRMR